MIVAVTMALAACLFGVAGWNGTLLAQLLCSGRAPHADGPAPIRFARWPFALAAACIGLACAVRGAPLWQLGLGLIAIVVLAAAAAADLACGILPDALTLGPLVIALGIGFITRTWAPCIGAAMVAVPFAALALYSRGRGMGWGDVKLAALGGALLGVREAALAFMLAAIVAYVIARRRGIAERPIAFGPYLAASIATTFAVRGVF